MRCKSYLLAPPRPRITPSARRARRSSEDRRENKQAADASVHFVRCDNTRDASVGLFLRRF